jgi:hypothetical protein
LTANTIKILSLIILLNLSLFSQQDTTEIQDTTTISSDVFVMQKSPWGAVDEVRFYPGGDKSTMNLIGKLLFYGV